MTQPALVEPRFGISIGFIARIYAYYLHIFVMIQRRDGVTSMLTRICTGAILAALKGLPFVRQAGRSFRYAVRSYQEKEMGLLEYLVRPDKLAIDVGAHMGAYTHLLLRLGVSVVVVEANPQMAALLTRLYGRKAKIVCAAASSSSGSITLRIPKISGIATVEPKNGLNNDNRVERINVRKVMLDDLELDPVGFIKIDVEGHELDVLLGARSLLERDHPTILVECEERHKPDAVQSLCDLLLPLGYHGFILDNGRLTSIANFNSERDQYISDGELPALNAGVYRGRYINNFIFLV